MPKVYIFTKSAFPFGRAMTNRLKCYAKALALENVDYEIIILQRNKIIDNNNHSLKGIYNYRYISGKCSRSSNKMIAFIHDIYDLFLVFIFLLRKLKKK